MRELLYIVGPPGVGKTTALAAALGRTAYEERTVPFAYRVYQSTADHRVLGVQLGGFRAKFGGTDTLGMAVQPKVLAWLADEKANEGVNCIVAEGDRLGCGSFFAKVKKLGWDLTVCCVMAPWDVCQARRNARGSAQNEVWLRGRHSKCEKLLAEWCSAAWAWDGCRPQLELVEKLRSHPVIQALRGA